MRDRETERDTKRETYTHRKRETERDRHREGTVRILSAYDSVYVCVLSVSLRQPVSKHGHVYMSLFWSPNLAYYSPLN